MNVPGFNGKLLGRRNFEDFFMEFSSDVFAFRSPSSIGVTLADVGTMSVGTAIALDERTAFVVEDIDTSICNGEAQSTDCIFDDLKSFFEDNFSFSLAFVVVMILSEGLTKFDFVGLRLSAMRVKLNDFFGGSLGFVGFDRSTGDHMFCCSEICSIVGSTNEDFGDNCLVGDAVIRERGTGLIFGDERLD